MKNLRAVRRGRSRKSASEKDDSSTRLRVLEAAGHVFAEQGFERATGKEICRRAGVNAAAINYHFGGIGNLYLAVLEDIRNRLAVSDSIIATVGAQTCGKNKLRAAFALIVGAAFRSNPSSYVGRIIGRELIFPSGISKSLVKKGRKRATFLVQMVAELMELPQDHPAVARGCVSVLAPIHWLFIVDRRLIRGIFPNLGLGPNDVDALVDHMADYAFAGLRAIADKERNKARQPSV
ncbi:MAG: TetR/AcrR family transcriptional regulator [Rhizomicrobium sp.]|jgi:AcrR family transcriptional regulator